MENAVISTDYKVYNVFKVNDQIESDVERHRKASLWIGGS